jgi:ABC-type transporter Mla MlaB component
VLKVTTRRSRSLRVLTIKLEGELRERWLPIVRDACSQPDRPSWRLRLDLAALTYADAAGVQLLRELVGGWVEIAACSGFVGELLRLERP